MITAFFIFYGLPNLESKNQHFVICFKKNIHTRQWLEMFKIKDGL